MTGITVNFVRYDNGIVIIILKDCVRTIDEVISLTDTIGGRVIGMGGIKMK